MFYKLIISLYYVELYQILLYLKSTQRSCLFTRRSDKTFHFSEYLWYSLFFRGLDLKLFILPQPFFFTTQTKQINKQKSTFLFPPRLYLIMFFFLLSRSLLDPDVSHILLFVTQTPRISLFVSHLLVPSPFHLILHYFLKQCTSEIK